VLAVVGAVVGGEEAGTDIVAAVANEMEGTEEEMGVGELILTSGGDTISGSSSTAGDWEGDTRAARFDASTLNC